MKISSFNILAIGRLLWETLYLVFVGVNSRIKTVQSTNTNIQVENQLSVGLMGGIFSRLVSAGGFPPEIQWEIYNNGQTKLVEIEISSITPSSRHPVCELCPLKFYVRMFINYYVFKIYILDCVCMYWPFAAFTIGPPDGRSIIERTEKLQKNYNFFSRNQNI